MDRNVKLALAVIVIASLPALAQMKPESKSASPKAGIADRWITAWNSHDVEKVVAVFPDAVMYEDIPFAEANHGKAELRKFVASELESVPDLKVELESSAVEGSHGSIQWVFSGTDKGIYKTGKKFKVRGATILTLKGGKISRNVDYYDAATIMRQVGQLPAENTSAQ